jgi:hypothetical protein
MKLFHLQETDRTGNHHVTQNKPDSERQISYIFYYSLNLDLKKEENDMNIKRGLHGIWGGN